MERQTGRDAVERILARIASAEVSAHDVSDDDMETLTDAVYKEIVQDRFALAARIAEAGLLDPVLASVAIADALRTRHLDHARRIIATDPDIVIEYSPMTMAWCFDPAAPRYAQRMLVAIFSENHEKSASCYFDGLIRRGCLDRNPKRREARRMDQMLAALVAHRPALLTSSSALQSDQASYAEKPWILSPLGKRIMQSRSAHERTRTYIAAREILDPSFTPIFR